MEEMYAYRCEKCGRLHHPRYYVCQTCGHREFEALPLEGKCRLVTWTRAYNLPEGYMRPWLNFGVVQFENGLTASGQIGFDEGIANGMELVSSVGMVREGVGTDFYGFIFQRA